jgi:small GTP-binding protein
MIQKKICLLGTSGVGKTSLIARFVHSMFFDKYHTTVGVKVDKKTIMIDGAEVVLVIWDLAGDDRFQPQETKYLRGTSGYLMVVDGTRRVTLDHALDLQKRVADQLDNAPFVLVLNKADLAPQWEVDEAQISALASQGFTIVKTSAKEGTAVEEAFADLARRMVQPA